MLYNSKQGGKTFNQIHSCEISVSDLRLWVHLGCSAEEKTHVQPISVHIRLRFPTPPKACQTDALQDTVCYQHMSELANAAATKQAFSLIEHLAMSVHESIQHYLIETGYKDTQLIVTINKLSPPIPYILGGVSCTYSGETK